MKKGFTLIELLAVIIILAVIALIATPIVLDVVDNAKEKSRLESVNGLIDGTRLYASEALLKDLSLTGNLYSNVKDRVSGKVPETGEIFLGENNKVAIAVKLDKYCYIKNFEDSNVTRTESEECSLKEQEVSYNVGDYVTVQLASGITKNFYILSVDNGKVTAILDRNLGDNTVWASEEKIMEQAQKKGISDVYSLSNEELYAFLTELGPVTALTQLEGLNWSNVDEVRLPNAEELIAQTQWYKGLSLEQQQNWEEEYIIILQTVVLDETFQSIAQKQNCTSNDCYRNIFEIVGYGDILVPTWLDINLNTSGDNSLDTNGYYKYGYWTNNIVPAFAENAWDLNGGAVSPESIIYPGIAGVRPVIEIDVSYIQKVDYKDYTKESFEAGEYLQIQVGENRISNFYVLEDNGNTITAILDENYIVSEWGNEGDITPTIANEALPKNWTNASEVRLPSVEDLIVHTDWYKELSDKDNWESQAYISSTLPGWLGYDSNNSLAYWTTELIDNDSAKVAINMCGFAFGINVYIGDSEGVRPIIEIDKSHIVSILESSISGYSCEIGSE